MINGLADSPAARAGTCFRKREGGHTCSVYFFFSVSIFFGLCLLFFLRSAWVMFNLVQVQAESSRRRTGPSWGLPGRDKAMPQGCSWMKAQRKTCAMVFPCVTIPVPEVGAVVVTLGAAGCHHPASKKSPSRGAVTSWREHLGGKNRVFCAGQRRG